MSVDSLKVRFLQELGLREASLQTPKDADSPEVYQMTFTDINRRPNGSCDNTWTTVACRVLKKGAQLSEKYHGYVPIVGEVHAGEAFTKDRVILIKDEEFANLPLGIQKTLKGESMSAQFKKVFGHQKRQNEELAAEAKGEAPGAIASEGKRWQETQWDSTGKLKTDLIETLELRDMDPENPGKRLVKVVLLDRTQEAHLAQNTVPQRKVYYTGFNAVVID